MFEWVIRDEGGLSVALQILFRRIFAVVGVIVFSGFISACSQLVEGDGRALQPLSSQTVSALRAMGSSPGEAMMVRIYKQSSELEVWKRVEDGTFKLFRTYEICTFSGELGPKIREGDRQSPEGFYTVTPGLMNPRSNYYLSFNLGFPNKFDRAYGRTGSNIMVHGDCSSRGCYAMTDVQVAEIYALARESFVGGNRSFQVQVYPFRMTPENLAAHWDNPNMAYWQNLKVGYDHTEVTGKPPTWDVCNREYVFNATSQSGLALDARAACPALKRNPEIERLVAARQRADQAAFEVAVANIREERARQSEEEARRQAEAAALAQRSQAINESVSGAGNAVGNFFSNLFGGGGQSRADPGVEALINPDLVAPIPRPRLSRG